MSSVGPDPASLEREKLLKKRTFLSMQVELKSVFLMKFCLSLKWNFDKQSAPLVTLIGKQYLQGYFPIEIISNTYG